MGDASPSCSKPVEALTQSFTRTKANDYNSFKQTMELKANSSNNTIFADAEGDIAYFQGNYIPRRDTQFRLDEAGRWQQSCYGLQRVDERRRDAASAQPGKRLDLQLERFAMAALRAEQLKKADFPAYVDSGTRVRARTCTRCACFQDKHDFTLDCCSPPRSTAISPGSRSRCPR